MANKLRQNLTDPLLRSAIKERCCSVPSSPGRVDSSASNQQRAHQVEATLSSRAVEAAASGNAVDDRSRQLPTSSRFVQQQKRAPKGVASRHTKSSMIRAQSVGALSSPQQPRPLATDRDHVPAVTSRPRRGKLVEVTVNSDPIPIRGRRNQGDCPHGGNSDTETNTISRAASAASLRAAETPETVTSTWESPGFASRAFASNVFATATGRGRPLDSHGANLSAAAGSVSGFDVQQQLQLQDLQIVQDRLLTLESERRRSNPSLGQVGGQAGADATGSPEAERPQWLVADGRFRTAKLEGENWALRRAVIRSRQENEELIRKRSIAEERMKALSEENQAAAFALRQCAALSASYGRLPTSAATLNGLDAHPSQGATGQSPSEGNTTTAAASLRNLVFMQPASTLALATRPDVSTVAAAPPAVATAMMTSHWQLGLPGDKGAVVGESERARCRLLETSEDIGRRMEEIKERQAKQARNKLMEAIDAIERPLEEILSRRGKLQTSIGSEVHAIGTGSPSFADEDSEGYHSSRNLAPLGVSSA